MHKYIVYKMAPNRLMETYWLPYNHIIWRRDIDNQAPNLYFLSLIFNFKGDPKGDISI